MADASETIKAFDRVRADRRNFESLWQETAELVLPSRDFTVKRSPGTKRNQKIFDATAPYANEQFAAGLHGYLTSLKWFSLELEDEALMQDDDNRLWLEDTTMRMYNVFNRAEFGFDPAASEMYLDIGAFGNGCMYVAELPNSILFQSRALNECFPTENSKGQIDTMYRLFEYSAQQAVQEWGDKVKGIPQIEEAVDKKKDTRFEFLHCVKPNVDYGRGGIRGRTRWRGEYIFLPTKETIDESRFHEFPFIFPRWARIAGEVFGYGPAMTVLPDIKMVNAMMKTIIKAAQKIVDPPLQVPDDTFLHTIRMTPSALNFYRSGANDRIEPIETKGRPDIGLEMVQNIQGKIERAFHTDLLEMPEEKNEGSRVAATWVMQRRQEKMRLMAPMLSRMQTEFLGNLIDRVFNIMLRKKAFLPVPPSLSGARLKPVYVSPVAKAQRAQEAEGLLNLFNLMQPIAPLDPSAMKILKGDEVMRFAGDIYSVPTRLFRSREEMQQMKEEQAQVDRNGIMAQNVVEGAGAAKDAASAVKDIASVQQGQPK